MNKRRDGHVHSHYCPHGSNDSFEMYLENAINKGIYEITFTEHMTMPEDIVIEGMESNFLDSVSPSIENMDKYINEVRYYKEKYKDKIKINVGLEVDYLEGYEELVGMNLACTGSLQIHLFAHDLCNACIGRRKHNWKTRRSRSLQIEVSLI